MAKKKKKSKNAQKKKKRNKKNGQRKRTRSNKGRGLKGKRGGNGQNQRRKNRKNGERIGKEKRRKSEKKKKNKKEAKRRQKKKNGKKKRKNQKERTRKTKNSTCLPTTCVNIAVQAMKLIKDKVANFEKQDKRITKNLGIGGKKSGKQHDFKPTLQRLADATGGNISNPVCSGSSESAGAKQMLNLSVTLN